MWPRLRYSAYNIAAGSATSVGELIAWAAEKVPGFRAEILPPVEADILQDPNLSGGMWGAYDVSRIVAETGWRPRATRESLHAYMSWIAAQP